MSLYLPHRSPIAPVKGAMGGVFPVKRSVGGFGALKA